MNKTIGVVIAVVVVAAVAGIGYITLSGRYQTEPQVTAPPVVAPQAPPAPPPGAPQQAPNPPPVQQDVSGTKLSQADIAALTALFNDQPVLGGQKMPRFVKWVNDKVFIYLQFDKSDAKEATELRLIGIGIKDVFCKETQPQGADFRHFHRLTAPTYSAGHGGQPGENGYWLFSMAVTDYASGQTTVKTGSTAAFPVTESPQCGAYPPDANFEAPGAKRLSQNDIASLIAVFNDQPVLGGQKMPRFSKWVNDKVFIYLQFDKSDAKEATELRLIGLGIKGEFCKEVQPQTADFRHFHRLTAPTYSAGHGGAPHEKGYWLFAIATQDFGSGQTGVKTGATSAFPVTDAPQCGA